MNRDVTQVGWCVFDPNGEVHTFYRYDRFNMNCKKDVIQKFIFRGESSHRITNRSKFYNLGYTVKPVYAERKDDE